MRAVTHTMRRRLGFALAGVCLLVVVAVALGVSVSIGKADGDSLLSASEEAAAIQLTSNYQAGCRESLVVPSYAQDEVEARQKELKAAKAPPIAEGQAHEQVLPDRAITQLGERREEALASSCTLRYQEDQKVTDWAMMVDAALYNNPSSPPLIDSEFELLAVQCKKKTEDHCLIWALLWGADITTAGRGVQSWSVYEYSLLLENGEWRIDNESLVACMAATSSEWGPGSPHEPIDACDQMLTSVLYPGQRIPGDELLTLAAHTVQ